MTKLMLFSLLGLAPGAVSATATGHCDSKPFTLKKPSAAAPAPPAPPKTEMAQAKPVPAPAPKPKPRVTIGCKQSAAK
jgi:hypothetical protein